MKLKEKAEKDEYYKAHGRVIPVLHDSPFKGYESLERNAFILLPYGINLNAEMRTATPEDRIRFGNGDEAKIKSVCAVPMKSKLANVLCGIRYGSSIAAKKVQWAAEADAMGFGRNAASEDTCILVWHSDARFRAIYGDEYVVIPKKPSKRKQKYLQKLMEEQ